MNKTIPLHGGQLRQIAELSGIPIEGLRDFSANINPAGPPAAVRNALRRALDDPSILTTYPDLEELALRKALASYSATAPENIVVGNGFVPLLNATLRALSVQRCLLPVPSFIEYRRTLAHASVDIVARNLDPHSSFRYDIESLLDASVDAVLLANPQNPTGVLHNRDALLELTCRAAERNILVLLDEAFIDYCPEASLTCDAPLHRNLIVFRSVTKFFGIAGLRVAHAVTSAEIASSIQDQVAPWSITTLASRAVIAALADAGYVHQTRALNDHRKEWLAHELQKLSLRPEPSSANFILFRLPPGVHAIQLWNRMIEEHRMVLRLCCDYEALPEGYLRAAVRGDSDNRELIAALRQTLVSRRHQNLDCAREAAKR